MLEVNEREKFLHCEQIQHMGVIVSLVFTPTANAPVSTTKKKKLCSPLTDYLFVKRMKSSRSVQSFGKAKSLA